MSGHEWKSVDVGAKTQEECRLFLQKYGIESLIHGNCQRIGERRCEKCKVTVSVEQLDKGGNGLLGTMINSVDWNKCE